MSKYVASLAVAAGLVAMPAGASASSVCPPGQPSGVAPLYCVPISPAEAAHSTARSAAGYLAKLRPAALAGKGSVSLSGTAAGPGTIKIVLTAKIHGMNVVIGSGEKTTGSAGATTVKLMLTRAGRNALRTHKGKLKVTVTTTFTPTGGTAATASTKVTLK